LCKRQGAKSQDVRALSPRRGARLRATSEGEVREGDTRAAAAAIERAQGLRSGLQGCTQLYSTDGDGRRGGPRKMGSVSEEGASPRVAGVKTNKRGWWMVDGMVAKVPGRNTLGGHEESEARPRLAGRRLQFLKRLITNKLRARVLRSFARLRGLVRLFFSPLFFSSTFLPSLHPHPSPTPPPIYIGGHHPNTPS
jgi:hypothetical protein